MRKTKLYQVGPDGGRDAGKTFLLTEASASRAERWALRAFMAMARAKVELPESVTDLGVAGVATLAFSTLAAMDFDEATILLDEMMTCVQCVPDKERPEVVRALVESDIDEVATRFELKKEVMRLHVDF